VLYAPDHTLKISCTDRRPQANFTSTVQAVTSAMAKVTAEAQYPGYKCLNAPTQML
jgi:hypothetical protein